MRRSVMRGLACCLVTVGTITAAWSAQNSTLKTAEQKAWEEVDSLNKQSLQDFLTQFPDGTLASQAKLAIELQDKIAGIKNGNLSGVFTIPIAVLGKEWTVWQEFNPKRGVGGYSLDEKGRLGGLRPAPLSGGKTYAAARIHQQHRLWALMPAGDGSILALRTSGRTFEVFKGLVFETPGNEPLYFGVIEGKGWVHLKGVGKVTLPDGKTTELK